ncbi:MAG: hypothetical protein P1U38_08595 [Aeromicrobium sp.]|uniref:hypothetical protein n=1 Tax=Aeromicrobium sp. TaxID=1871063 RepID=UPI0025BBF257|nr:hypothetical protein [Aeromicrobium sp.]MCK5891580.1 hypothetical protein [Aeromicrobium sp.]MDF1704820.1 hypothetical protein [Aeromicrobium sp.]
MRLSRSLVLAHLLLRYVGRRVLRAGVLASRPIRMAVGTALLALLAAAVAGAVTFLEPLRSEPAAWDLLLDVTTVSTVLWCLAAAVLVKTLFLNAEGMLSLTFALPVTNRERAAAFVLYEAAMSAAVVTAGVCSLSIASLIVRGPRGLVPLVEAVALPALLTYVTVSLAHHVLTRLLTLAGLRRTQPAVLVVLLFVLLVAYVSTVPRLTAQASAAYLDATTERPWTSVVAVMAGQIGHPAAIVGGFLTAAVLAGATIWLTPDRHVRQARFLPWRAGVVTRRLFGPHEWCVFRSFQTWLSAVLAVALLLALCARPVVHPLWSLSLLSMGALYQFAATAPLRQLHGGSPSAWAAYGRLVRAQALLWLTAAVPAAAVTVAARPELAGGLAVPAAASLAGAVVALGIGIIFPAEDDNPFSIFVGVSLTAALLALLGLGVGVLRLPAAAAAASAAATLALFVIYSVLGIAASASRSRHEEGPRPRQQPGRSRAADPRAQHRDPAVPHVLER